MGNMQHLKDTPASTLYWIQRERKPECELRSDSELFCTLRWSTWNPYDPISVVSADGQWTIINYFPGRTWIAHITSSNSGGDIATASRFSDIVKFADGRKFKWRTNFWLTRCTISDESSDNLLFLKVANNLFTKFRVRVDLEQRAKDLRCGGWF
jgi:hypothetical protein